MRLTVPSLSLSCDCSVRRGELQSRPSRRASGASQWPRTSSVWACSGPCRVRDISSSFSPFQQSNHSTSARTEQARTVDLQQVSGILGLDNRPCSRTQIGVGTGHSKWPRSAGEVWTYGGARRTDTEDQRPVVGEARPRQTAASSTAPRSSERWGFRGGGRYAQHFAARRTCRPPCGELAIPLSRGNGNTFR